MLKAVSFVLQRWDCSNRVRRISLIVKTENLTRKCSRMGNLTRKCLAESRHRGGVPSKSFYGRNYVVSKFPSSSCETSCLLFSKMENQGKLLNSQILGPQNISHAQNETYIDNNHWVKLFEGLFWAVNNVSNAFKISNTFSAFTRGGQRLTCPFGDKGPLVMCGKSVCKGWQQAVVIIGRNIYWCHHRQASNTFYCNGGF